jgi:hypothetical protein
MCRTVLFTVCALLLAAGLAWGGAEVPQGVSPGGSRVVSLIEARCPTFSWSWVTGARGYELVVYEVDEAVLEATDTPEGEERAPLFRVSVPGTAVSWTPSMDRCLEAGGRYVWFVRALGEGVGRWSEVCADERGAVVGQGAAPTTAPRWRESTAVGGVRRGAAIVTRPGVGGGRGGGTDPGDGFVDSGRAGPSGGRQ